MKIKWQKHYDAQQNKAIKEACLHHVAGVKELAWVPADYTKPRQVDPTTKKLLGKYVLNVHKLNLRDDGDLNTVPTFEVHPDSSWVEDNFDPYYLATAQQIAIDYWEQISPVDQRHVEHGFIMSLFPWIQNRSVNFDIFQKGKAKMEKMLLQHNGLDTAETHKGRLSWLKTMLQGNFLLISSRR